ncbi:GTPase Obg [bioreactor metagenome]|uniref:GTPase Obg n=1 Tax=bioreactor metagenome TaxID=1076179 RepID=A0A645EU12_9ZZZZ
MDEDGANERLEAFKAKIKKPVIGISALTGEGIDKLVYKCADLLVKTPQFPLYDENSNDTGVKVYTVENEKGFVINRLDAHTFVITGEKIEKFYKMTNTTTDEGMMKLITHLRVIGIDDELAKIGAQDGDTIKLCDFEFEYVE